jgi:arsenite-transporting ATPase
MHALLADRDKTSIRLVLTLEQVVIKEAERSFTYFHLYDYPTDLVVANRVMPAQVGRYFQEWYETQQDYAPLVEQAFMPIPVRQVPFCEREVVGNEMLRELARSLYGDQDPTEFFYRGRPYHVRRENGSFILSVELPFTSKEQIQLSRRGDELLIDLGTWRRSIVLPRVLVEAPTEGANFEDHVLKVRFAAPTPQSPQPQRR